MASLGCCLPLRPRDRCRHRRRPGRTAGSSSAPLGTRSPQRSCCAPGSSRGSPTIRAPEGVVDQRTQEAGTGGRWRGSRAPGCLSGFHSAQKSPESRNGRCLAGISPCPNSGAVNGLGSLGLPAVHGFSRPGVSRKSAVAGAARRPLAPQHPRRGTGSARRALTPAARLSRLRSPGEGGDTKAPRRSQSAACFLGRRGDTALRSQLLSQSAPGSVRELWEL